MRRILRSNLRCFFSSTSGSASLALRCDSQGCMMVPQSIQTARTGAKSNNNQK